MNLDEYLDRATEMRNEIAVYDEKIVRLLDERVQLAKNLVELKKEYSRPAYTPIVEEKKIEYLSTLTSYPDLIKMVWPMIMGYSRIPYNERI
jgi:chorismate mutase